MTERVQPRKSIDLLTLPLVGRFLRWRHARTVLQSMLLIVAGLIVYDGLTGPPIASRNLAGALPWLHWRGFVLLALLLVGNLFCMACPFMLWRRLGKKFLPAGWVWPAALRSKWLAAGLLGLYIWSYEAFDLWASPWLTAWIVIGYFTLAFLIDGLFRGATFCKYLCPIGQFNFLNSLVSPTEVSVRDTSVCDSCVTKDCIQGRKDPTDGRLLQNGCELYLFQPKKVGNMDCTFCMECIHACPHENVGIQLRHPGSELWINPSRSGIGQFTARFDLAAMALVLTFAGFMNAAGMIAPTANLQGWLQESWGLSPLLTVTLLFTLGLLVLPLILVTSAAKVSESLGAAAGSLRANISRFAYAFVPLGFGMWLAHHLFHFLQGGLSIVPLAQSFAARAGLDLFGVPNWALSGVVPSNWLVPIELILLELGAAVSCVVAYRIAKRDLPDAQMAKRAVLPWAALIILLSLAGIWILLQPMEMRGMMMEEATQEALQESVGWLSSGIEKLTS